MKTYTLMNEVKILKIMAVGYICLCTPNICNYCIFEMSTDEVKRLFWDMLETGCTEQYKQEDKKGREGLGWEKNEAR